MVHMVVYPIPGAFRQRLAIMTVREHICGFHELQGPCIDAAWRVDPDTGHRLCSGCGRITLASGGLSNCDICYTEFIDKTKLRNPAYEVNCPRCIEKYGIEDE